MSSGIERTGNDPGRTRTAQGAGPSGEPAASTDPAKAAPPLSFDRITKRFTTPAGGSLLVLDSVSFDVPDHEFSVLIGPSGCGKTTFLTMAAGLDFPDEGAVTYMGERIGAINTGVGYVTQDDHLFPWYTVYENIEFPLRIRGVAASERRDRVERFMRIAHLEGFEDYYPHQISGGMRSRASIVRTLVYSPPVILMDEPFGALDAQTRMFMHRDLLDLWRQERTSILFVTHDLHEAVLLGDHVTMLSHRPSHIAETVDVDIPRPRDPFRPYDMEGFVDKHKTVMEVFRERISFGED